MPSVDTIFTRGGPSLSNCRLFRAFRRVMQRKAVVSLRTPNCHQSGRTHPQTLEHASRHPTPHTQSHTHTLITHSHTHYTHTHTHTHTLTQSHTPQTYQTHKLTHHCTHTHHTHTTAHIRHTHSYIPHTNTHIHTTHTKHTHTHTKTRMFSSKIVPCAPRPQVYMHKACAHTLVHG